MTDLTEQWKKGELPEGWYWVKRVTWSECINMLYNWSDTFLDGDVPVDNDQIIEVLAPVPSYDEWKRKDDALTSLLAEYGKLTKELQDEKEKHMTRPSLRSPADEMVVEKQVWESTLNRSMKLQAENETLKDLLEECREEITGNFESFINIIADGETADLIRRIDEVLNAE